MNESTRIDEGQVLEDMREEYRKETGEELPDHVLENYDDFLAVRPTVDDIQEAMERGREIAPEEYTEPEVQRLLKTTLSIGIAIGLTTGIVIGLIVGVTLL